ncbi:MAG: sugar phosphate isomerase/epimerase family protein, partial [bacterium]
TSMAHDFDVCMKAYARAGIRHVEPWIHKIRQFVEKESLPVARRVLTDNGLHAPSSCCMGELIEPRDDHAQKVDQLKSNLEVVRELGIERFVVHSFTQEQFRLDDYKRGVDHVRELGEIGEEFGVVINIEFIRMQRFLGTLPTALRLVREAGHPYARALFDFYHFWAGQGKMADLDLLEEGEPDHIHFHDAPDGPREILVDADRVFPGEGVIPIQDILDVLRRNNYTGCFSVELFGKQNQEADPYEMAKRAIETSSRFLT